MGNYAQKSNLSYRGKPTRNAVSIDSTRGVSEKGRGPTMQKVLRDTKTKQRLGRYKTER